MQGRCYGEVLTPEGDDRKNCRCTYYAPAEPDAAQEAAMDELVHLRQEMEGTEPEAPECEHAWGDWDAVYHGGYLQWRDCQRCRASESRACWPFGPKEPPEPKAPSRPPFTLTYVLASGERREVTLPGDATVRAAFNGTLVITHGSDVRALTEIRPMGEA